MTIYIVEQASRCIVFGNRTVTHDHYVFKTFEKAMTCVNNAIEKFKEQNKFYEVQEIDLNQNAPIFDPFIYWHVLTYNQCVIDLTIKRKELE